MNKKVLEEIVKFREVGSYIRTSPTGKLVTVKPHPRGGRKDWPTKQKKVVKNGKKALTKDGKQTQLRGDLTLKKSNLKDLFKIFNKNYYGEDMIIPVKAKALMREYNENMNQIKKIVEEAGRVKAARSKSKYKKLIVKQRKIIKEFFEALDKANNKDGEKESQDN